MSALISGELPKTPAAARTLVERTKSDYLSISRNRTIYHSTAAWLAAESSAWEQLMAAVRHWESLKDAHPSSPPVSL